MKRVYTAGILACVLGIGLLTGCQKTPEESLIKQKGEASLKNYEEGETLNNQTSTEQEEGTGEENQTEGENVLRAALQAPETYQSETKDETGKLQILTDATVEIPNVSKVSAISVSQHPLDQETMDRITETFFKDAVIYSGTSYFEWTKADWQRRIEELKGYVAEGNLDPYNYGTDPDGNLMFDIYENIEAAEHNYEEAPEEKTLVEVHPQFGLLEDDGKGNQVPMNDYFDGVAETADGDAYWYIMKSYGGNPMEVSIKKIHEADISRGNSMWVEYDAVKGSNDLPEEEKVVQNMGISFEDAKKLADEKVASLQLEHMELNTWSYGLKFQIDGNYQQQNIQDYGYTLCYTRRIQGMPITYTMNFGGALEDIDSEMETWGYEVLNITVTGDGIDEVYFQDQYDLGETKTENLNLLSFPEIMKIYEKMMVIQNADAMNYENSRIYRINRIVFGYSRIYEPSSDSTTGVLVPVWDFFGTVEVDAQYGEETYHDINEAVNQSHLTINGVDGSVIDRGLGY